MSSLLDEHMTIRRLIQASDTTNRQGPALPDEILGQFTASVAADDVEAVCTLLDEHFPDRSTVFPGRYKIQELYPVLSEAARHDQVDILNEILVPYPYPFSSINFVAREAVDAGSYGTLQLLLGHGWDINRRIGAGPNVLESLLNQCTPDGDVERDMIVWLLDAGAGLNERPYHTDTTGMSQAVEHAPLDFVKDLLDNYGGDVHYGQLLHHALSRKSQKPGIVEMLRLLLEHGNIEAVKFLLSKGADTGIISTRTETTALEWAEKAGHREVVSILRSPDKYKL